MRFTTFAAGLAIALAGCVNETAQQSTLPEPIVVSGPPGGSIDPGYSYDQYAGDPAYENSAETAPAEAQNEAPAEPPAEAPPALDTQPYAGPAPDAAPQAGPANPMGNVDDSEIDATLDGYGQWIDTDDYGAVWRPDATVVGVDFTPYETAGSWAYTDYGWAFASDWDWGWLPFHYGRWAWFENYWGWVPDYSWGPGWCEWRHGNGVVGWRPMGPQIRDHRTGHHPVINPNVRDHRHPQQHDMHWRFAAESDFGKPHVHSHLMNNLGEGLRLTSVVARPPVRGTRAVAATDLMKQRFTRGSYVGAGTPARPRPGSHAIGTYPPSRPYNPGYTYSPPTRSYNPPTRSYNPRPYNPGYTYQPPARPYNPRPYNPGSTYSPPSRPGSAYQPPARPSYTYSPPSRPGSTYQPPTRSYNPSHGSYPTHAYSPPSRSFSPSGGGYAGGGSHYSGGGGGGSHYAGGSSSHSSGGSSSHSSGGSSHSSGGGGHHR